MSWPPSAQEQQQIIDDFIDRAVDRTDPEAARVNAPAMHKMPAGMPDDLTPIIMIGGGPKGLTAALEFGLPRRAQHRGRRIN